MNQPLHVKYRPSRLADMIGQDSVVHSLESVLESKSVPHAFLFLGPSGCGKTTLARIIANKLDCEVIEVDAATHTGIDATRQVTESLKYTGFGEQPNRMLIIDECHSLSKAAWQSLLKILEEPPAHVYFALCTTEPSKVPDTIHTRCATYTVNSLRRAELDDLMTYVVRQEKFSTPDRVIGQVVASADGSARKALVMLAMVHDLEDEDEVADVLAQHVDNREVIELCRTLVDRSLTWDKAIKVIAGLKDENPESMRIVIVNYLAASLMGSKNEKQTIRLLDVLGQFQTPCNTSEKYAPILLALGNLIYPPGGKN